MSFGIEKVEGGYIVSKIGRMRQVFKTFDEVLNEALLHFEGRSSSFSGDSYGHVVIVRRDTAAQPRRAAVSDELAAKISRAVQIGSGGPYTDWKVVEANVEGLIRQRVADALRWATFQSEDYVLKRAAAVEKGEWEP